MVLCTLRTHFRLLTSGLTLTSGVAQVAKLLRQEVVASSSSCSSVEDALRSPTSPDTSDDETDAGGKHGEVTSGQHFRFLVSGSVGEVHASFSQLKTREFGDTCLEREIENFQ